MLHLGLGLWPRPQVTTHRTTRHLMQQAAHACATPTPLAAGHWLPACWVDSIKMSGIIRDEELSGDGLSRQQGENCRLEEHFVS